MASDCELYPLGEELTVNIGARSTNLDYGSTEDNVRQKFTGYQKDTETSLDFAEARMYENRFGRFTAVDPLLASGKSANPQTFNRYAYTSNNPIVRIDINGEDWYYHDELKVNRLRRSYYHRTIYWVNDGINLAGRNRYKGGGVLYETGGLEAGRYTALDPYEGNQRTFDTRAEAVAQYQAYLQSRNTNVTRGFADALASPATTSPLIGLIYEWGADAVIGQADPNSNVYMVTNRMTNAILMVESGVGGLGAISALRSSTQVRYVSGPVGLKPFDAFKAVFGKAGTGKAWHHIVEQNTKNVSKFGSEAIHNTENLIKLESGKGSIHSKVSGYYSSKQGFTNGLTVREWLSSKSFQEQYDFGIEVLRRFGGVQ